MMEDSSHTVKEISLKSTILISYASYEFLFLWNVLSMKYPVYEMSSMKCHIYEFLILWNILYEMLYEIPSMKCPIFEFLILWNVLSMKYPVYCCKSKTDW